MIKDLLQEGYILKSKGFHKHAIESFYKALEHDNNSYELLCEIAETYYLMKDEERALSYIEQALEKEPMHIDSLNLLKRIFMDKKAYAEAEQTVKNIFCITNDTRDLAEIFSLLNKQKKYNEIFEYNTELTSDRILYEKAYAKFSLNELDEANNIIDQALGLNKSLKYWLLKGKILFKMNRKSECVAIIEHLQTEQNDAEVLNFIGLVYQYQEEYKKALEYFQRATKILSQNDEYYYNCASTFFKMGDMQQAKFYYNRAISLSPDNQCYHFALANLYYAEKHYKRALEELNSDLWEARLLKSIILYDSGYLTLANIELEKLSQEQPENEIIKTYREKIRAELSF